MNNIRTIRGREIDIAKCEVKLPPACDAVVEITAADDRLFKKVRRLHHRLRARMRNRS